MKQIIDGKRYDTKTATQVASWHNGCSYSDFNHCEETLHLTKNGAWFIAGSGGALSSYAQSYEGGRTRGGGEAIRPLTADEARQWLEDHNEAAAIEQYFADKVQDA